MTTMREMVDSMPRAFEPEEIAAADELIPGWRDMSVAEFSRKARAASEGQWRIFAAAHGIPWTT